MIEILWYWIRPSKYDKVSVFFLICEFYTNFMNFVGDSAEKIEVDPENFEIISILSGYI